MHSEVQGRCNNDTSRELQGDTALKPGECIIAASIDIFYWHPELRGQFATWVSGVQLRVLRKENQSQTAIYWEPADDGSSLWLTSVTIECDGNDGSRALWVKNSPAYAGSALSLQPPYTLAILFAWIN